MATFQLFFQSGRANDLSAPLYIVFLLSFPRTRHVYRTESLRPRTHPVTDAGPRETIRHYTVGTPDNGRVQPKNVGLTYMNKI